jgi:hypothetical protein
VGACTQNLIKPETDCCKIEHFTAVFLYSKPERKWQK